MSFLSASTGSFHHDLVGKQRVFSAEEPPDRDSRANISVLRTSLSIDAMIKPYMVASSVGEKRLPNSRTEESVSLPSPFFLIEFIVRNKTSDPRVIVSMRTKER